MLNKSFWITMQIDFGSIGRATGIASIAIRAQWLHANKYDDSERYDCIL